MSDGERTKMPDDAWMLRPEYAAQESPVFRALWTDQASAELFRGSLISAAEVRPAVARVQAACEQIVQRALADHALYDATGKLSSTVLAQLAAAGYWGLLIDTPFGGSGATWTEFMPFLTRMARHSGTVAGLAAVHGCIGAAGQVQRFGNPRQQERWLPQLAAGQRLAAFALTEPGAGSDLTRLQTRATRRGDEWSITGEKLFITNAACGRTIGLVCLVDDHPAVIICDLPAEENENFQLVHYDLHALQHNLNRGIRLRDFRVPLENLITPPRGDGLTIAYHGLNRGRVALCAQAAGTMRRLLASMVTWSGERITHGQPLLSRELVLRRIGRLAALIIGCDALTAWCATLLDRGYRGELECVVAKVFASDALREAAVELALKTHGGRSFLKGNLVGDYLHDYLATSIYEGESELLSLAFIRTVTKPPRESAGSSTTRATSTTVGVSSPIFHGGNDVASISWGGDVRSAAARLASHSGTTAVLTQLRGMAVELAEAQRRHGAALADRQCLLVELSQRIQRLVIQLVAGQYGERHPDARVRAATSVLIDDLQRTLSGHRPTADEYERVVELGRLVSVDGLPLIGGS